MYIVYNHDRKVDEVLTEAVTTPGIISDVENIVADNERYRRIMRDKDAGRPGHYYGRDIIIEGAMPISLHLMIAKEYGDDPDWFKDDKKFQDVMKRYPMFSWLNG